MARISLAEIAAAMRGDLAPGTAPEHAAGGGQGGGPAEEAGPLGERMVSGYSIDSRTLQAGDLFFAIAGPRVDGHEFIGAAVRRGAAAVVVARGAGGAWHEAPAAIRVADTTRALQDLGAHVRRRRGLRVVGITGSAGKTTAKEMTAAILATRFRTFRSEGNLNNTYGLPLTLLRMADDSEAAVLEMGMSSKGEIARLTEIADPDVGVILNILRVHLEHFGSLEGIAAAKGELFAGMRQDAVAIYNADDPRATKLGRAFRGRSIGYGLTTKGCEITADTIATVGLEGTRFVLRRGEERIPVRLALLGRHQVYNALAAAASGYACGLAGDAIAHGLAEVRPAPMRGVLHRRPDGVEILDDSYNSNPTAMERAIDLLKEAKPRGRRILATGDMLELGTYEGRAHAKVGQLAARAGFDMLVAVGPRSRDAADAARHARGTPAGGAAGAIEVRHFETADDAAAFLAPAVRPGDLVLVKGSRGMKMEILVQALLHTAEGTH